MVMFIEILFRWRFAASQFWQVGFQSSGTFDDGQLRSSEGSLFVPVYFVKRQINITKGVEESVDFRFNCVPVTFRQVGICR